MTNFVYHYQVFSLTINDHIEILLTFIEGMKNPVLNSQIVYYINRLYVFLTQNNLQILILMLIKKIFWIYARLFNFH